MFVFFAILNPAFISQRNIFNILRQVAVYMVLGTGMTLVIGNGGIDLSVGSIAGLTACIAGTILEKAAPIIPLVPLAIVTAIIGAYSRSFQRNFSEFFKGASFNYNPRNHDSSAGICVSSDGACRLRCEKFSQQF